MPPPLNISTFTAGAIPVTNDKGEVTMQKVKVTRYVTGKRPTFAPEENSDAEDEDGFLLQEDRSFRKQSKSPERKTVTAEYSAEDAKDPRLKRLQRRNSVEEETSEEETDRGPSRYHRVIAEPEIIASGSGLSENVNLGRIRLKTDDDSDEDEDAIASRRAMLRERAQQRIVAEDVGVKVEEESEEEEDSDYEEGTDSEDESNPRLKPVFVRKQDRVSLQERKEEEKKAIEDEKKAKKQTEERKLEAKRLVEKEVKRDMEDELKKTNSEMDEIVHQIPIVLDNEDPEAEYEAWKVRELTRMKRDRDERDAFLKEQTEVERLRNLTEEERLRELAKNPREITNKSQKGKMKFLQKFYHRGVFYLDHEETVLKRDYTAPTLEDHHDKAVLPKVMQVKNFGRAGRTKYTHLVDQDTTKFDSAWTEQSTLNMKFHTGKAGGTKQVFEKPSAKRRKL